MNQLLRNILLIMACFVVFDSCETDPDIYIASKPVPVIYAVFDDHDTTHQILITKTFGAEKSPADFGFVRDSLYLDNVEVEVRLKEEYSDSWITIQAERVTDIRKDSGFFRYPEHEYYQFNRFIQDTFRYSIDSITLGVSIPGYDVAFCAHQRIDSIRIVSPKYDKMYLYLTPTSPLLFHWDWFGGLAELDPRIKPHAYNEIDVNFEIIEELEDYTRSKWVVIQNSAYNTSPTEKYRQLNITYEEFIREVILQIENDPEVITRRLGIINFHISGGDLPMKEYMKYYYGRSDYNYIAYTNFENAMGFFGTSTHRYQDSMRFDYETRQGLINENRLKWLKLNPWTSPKVK